MRQFLPTWKNLDHMPELAQKLEPLWFLFELCIVTQQFQTLDGYPI